MGWRQKSIDVKNRNQIKSGNDKILVDNYAEYYQLSTGYPQVGCGPGFLLIP